MVSPAKMRAVVWRITRCTRGTIFSSFWRRPSSTARRRMLAVYYLSKWFVKYIIAELPIVLGKGIIVG